MASYNIKTDFGAIGDDVANDAPAFAAFNAAAILDIGLVTLVIPAGTYLFSTTAAQFWAKGISQLRVDGAGFAFSALHNSMPADQGYFLGGRGILQNSSHSARVATVNSGASSVTLLTPADASLFTVGLYALITGFDLQGIYQAPYGYPPNPQYFEYVQVSGISGAIISFSAPLRNTYKQTWPLFNGGNAFEVDNGGPATLYAIDSSWNATISYNDLANNNEFLQTYFGAKSVSFSNVDNIDALGLVPSQNETVTFTDCDLSGCIIEVDKIITTLNYINTSINILQIQSSSVDTLNISGTCTINQMHGTPKKTVVTGPGVTIGVLGVGTNYGHTDQFIASNISVGSFGIEGTALQAATQVSSLYNGVFSFAFGKLITGAANNGSGKVRLTVTDVIGLNNNMVLNTGTSGSQPITLVDSTHVDLLTITFTSDTYSGGYLGNYAPSWAAPGTWCYAHTTLEVDSIFRVLDVTYDSTYFYVSTTYSGASIPTTISPHNCPSASFSNVTGCPEVVDFSQATAGKPIFSFSKRSYVMGTTGSTVQPRPKIWGSAVSISINVITPSASACVFHLSQFDNWQVRRYSDNTIVNFGPIINCQIAGERIITPTAIVGAQSGDTIDSTMKGSFWFGGTSFSGPKYSVDLSGTEPGVTVVLTIQADQGIGDVAPPSSLTVGVAVHKPPHIRIAHAVRGY